MQQRFCTKLFIKIKIKLKNRIQCCISYINYYIYRQSTIVYFKHMFGSNILPTTLAFASNECIDVFISEFTDINRKIFLNVSFCMSIYIYLFIYGWIHFLFIPKNHLCKKMLITKNNTSYILNNYISK